MTDIGQDFEIPDEMAVAQAEAMEEELQGRYTWEFTRNPGYMLIKGRNYYKTAGGKRSKDDNGAYKLLPFIEKTVKII